jgi:uncharacterized cysteine cluster protein YcgN (CxxCxxCC family)
MADFCKQCSELMFGEDFGDLATPEMSDGKFLDVLCEGCGATCVDRDGKCLLHTEEQHKDAILRGVMPK